MYTFFKISSRVGLGEQVVPCVCGVLLSRRRRRRRRRIEWMRHPPRPERDGFQLSFSNGRPFFLFSLARLFFFLSSGLHLLLPLFVLKGSPLCYQTHSPLFFFFFFPSWPSSPLPPSGSTRGGKGFSCVANRFIFLVLFFSCTKETFKYLIRNPPHPQS